MPCGIVTEIVHSETGRFHEEIYNRLFNVSPWIKLIRRGEFPGGMGEQLSVLTYERSAPTDAEPTWTAISVSEAPGVEGGACLPPATDVGIGSTVRNFNLQRRALHGPRFCAEELRFPFKLRQQLEAIITILTEYTRLEWEIRDRHEYLRLVKYKVTVDANLTETQNTTPPYFSGCPTSILTQGVLNRWKIRLLRDGAAMSVLGRRDGVPILTLITSAETSDDIIFRNADIRQDLRWGRPSELLAPFGVDRDYRGFYHLMDLYPIRGNCVGGVFTEVAPFASQAASRGNKSEINPTWNAVNSEISFIFDPMVFQQLIPRPITNPHPDFVFNPINYLGEWKIQNILDEECNPDGNLIRHRGILAAGSLPEHPERGVAFLHLKCDASLNLVTSCS